jgi:predicted nucleic acid-binding protein
MRPTIISGPRVLSRAADLTIAYNQHLFDTLYHAVALETGATLVTADDRYFAKARGEGGVVMLSDFQPAP